MSVFRVHKTNNYTTMSNYHFKDKRLSLKAKGLLSIMLSLPDDWDYSAHGLATLSSDGETAVRNGLHELEEKGYLERTPIRNKGIFKDWQYDIYELPKTLENITSVTSQSMYLFRQSRQVFTSPPNAQLFMFVKKTGQYSAVRILAIICSFSFLVQTIFISLPTPHRCHHTLLGNHPYQSSRSHSKTGLHASYVHSSYTCRFRKNVAHSPSSSLSSSVSDISKYPIALS